GRAAEHAGDVRVVPGPVAEALFTELAHPRRAVDARDDRDVVARAAAAVLALVAVERAHLLGWVEVDGLDVHADLVAVGVQVADAEILGVDVVADRDVACREADHLAVAPDRR